MRFLVTGADGFIGRAVCARVRGDGHQLRRALHRPDPMDAESVVLDLSAETGFGPSLAGIDCVIHLAARAHLVRDDTPDPLASFRAVNTRGTLALARQAAEAGVRRLVFLSSIKVNGEHTDGRGFQEEDAAAPCDPYARSKWEAEQGLALVASEMGLPITILRPPLVYGPGVRGNLGRLLDLVALGLPLPFAGVHNRRNLIGVENLAALILRAAQHPAAEGRMFVAAEDPAYSTPELIRVLADGIGRPARFFPVPAWLLAGAARTRLGGALSRLIGSLEVDSRRVRESLAWEPPVPAGEGLRTMARWYREEVLCG